MKKIITSSLLSVITLTAVSGVVLAADPSTTSKGSVGFSAASTNPKPFDPSDPTVPPKEVDENPDGSGKGTTGTLRFDRVPNFNFENIQIGSVDQTANVLEEKFAIKGSDPKEEFYSAPTVEITDVRGTAAGWTAFVKTDGKLVSGTSGTPEITGYTLKLNKGVASSYSGVTTALPTVSTGISLNETPQIFAQAAAGTGTASWGISYYDSSTGEQGKPKKNTTDTPVASDAVTLSVPQGATMHENETYTTTLTWYLSDDPSATEPNTTP
ncbi:WxL domain-containing protein [Vagococcus sp. JNUCC 83]